MNCVSRYSASPISAMRFDLLPGLSHIPKTSSEWDENHLAPRERHRSGLDGRESGRVEFPSSNVEGQTLSAGGCASEIPLVHLPTAPAGYSGGRADLPSVA